MLSEYASDVVGSSTVLSQSLLYAAVTFLFHVLSPSSTSESIHDSRSHRPSGSWLRPPVQHMLEDVLTVQPLYPHFTPATGLRFTEASKASASNTAAYLRLIVISAWPSIC